MGHSSLVAICSGATLNLRFEEEEHRSIGSSFLPDRSIRQSVDEDLRSRSSFQAYKRRTNSELKLTPYTSLGPFTFLRDQKPRYPQKRGSID